MMDNFLVRPLKKIIMAVLLPGIIKFSANYSAERFLDDILRKKDIPPHEGILKSIIFATKQVCEERGYGFIGTDIDKIFDLSVHFSCSNQNVRNYISVLTNIPEDLVLDKVENQWLYYFFLDLSDPKNQWSYNFFMATGIENIRQVLNDMDIINMESMYDEDDFLSDCYWYKSILIEAIKYLKSITNTDYNQIILFSRIDNHTSGLVVFADNVSANKQRYRIVIQSGVIYRAYVTKEEIVLNHIHDDSDYFNAVEETKAEAVVPIVIDGESVGCINVESEEENVFNHDMICKIRNLSRCLSKALTRVNYRKDIFANDLPYIHMDVDNIVEVSKIY